MKRSYYISLYYYFIYVNNSSIVQCILKYNFLYNFFVWFFVSSGEKQSALLSYIMRRQKQDLNESKDRERGILAERMKTQK